MNPTRATSLITKAPVGVWGAGRGLNHRGSLSASTVSASVRGARSADGMVHDLP